MVTFVICFKIMNIFKYFSKCVNSQWQCSNEVCGKRCSAVGDPHYTTFDGQHYNFMGQCSYTLIEHNDFIIEAENIPCSATSSQVKNFTERFIKRIKTNKLECNAETL